MAKSRKTFGKKNAPPLVLNAPGGSPNDAPLLRRRKMSMTVGLVSLGAATLVGGVLLEARQARIRAQECRAEAQRRGLPPVDCPSEQTSGRSHSSGGGGRTGWHFSTGSGSSSSTSDHGGSSTSHGLFGGFGHAGHAHSSGS